VTHDMVVICLWSYHNYRGIWGLTLWTSTWLFRAE